MPPVTVTSIAPVLSPKHLIAVVWADNWSRVGWVIVAELELLHPKLSVTVKE